MAVVQLDEHLQLVCVEDDPAAADSGLGLKSSIRSPFRGTVTA
jgi:hypothetical protein